MTLGDLLKDMTAMERRAKDPTRILHHIANLMASSVDRNFEAEGRPAWKPVRPATRRYKAKVGKSRILTLSGNLARSIQAKVQGTSVVLGTNVRHARIHQLGGKIQHYARSTWATARRTDEAGMGRFARTKGKRAHKSALHQVFTIGAHQTDIPARPFLVFQPGEQESYTQMVLNWFVQGGAQ